MHWHRPSQLFWQLHAYSRVPRHVLRALLQRLLKHTTRTVSSRTASPHRGVWTLVITIDRAADVLALSMREALLWRRKRLLGVQAVAWDDVGIQAWLKNSLLPGNGRRMSHGGDQIQTVFSQDLEPNACLEITFRWKKKIKGCARPPTDHSQPLQTGE